MDPWFGDVPDTIEIIGTRFRLAGEAIEEFEDPRAEYHESPPSGVSAWPATALVLLTRLQLDQMVEMPRAELRVDVDALSGREVERRLGMAAESLSDPADTDVLLREATAIGEGVDLWRALHASGQLTVSHALAIDGSVTLTIGPDLPDLRSVGINGSEDGELKASPAALFRVGQRLDGIGSKGRRPSESTPAVRRWLDAVDLRYDVATGQQDDDLCGEARQPAPS